MIERSGGKDIPLEWLLRNERVDSPNGTTILVKDVVTDGEVDLAASEAIAAETLRVLRDKFQRAPEWLAETERQLRVITRFVQPTESIQAIEADPTDDRILECAIAAGAEVIVSGDSHLLNLSNFRGIPIQRVAEFLASLGDQSRG